MEANDEIGIRRDVEPKVSGDSKQILMTSSSKKHAGLASVHLQQTAQQQARQSQLHSPAKLMQPHSIAANASNNRRHINIMVQKHDNQLKQLHALQQQQAKMLKEKQEHLREAIKVQMVKIQTKKIKTKLKLQLLLLLQAAAAKRTKAKADAVRLKADELNAKAALIQAVAHLKNPSPAPAVFLATPAAIPAAAPGRGKGP